MSFGRERRPPHEDIQQGLPWEAVPIGGLVEATYQGLVEHGHVFDLGAHEGFIGHAPTEHVRTLLASLLAQHCFSFTSPSVLHYLWRCLLFFFPLREQLCTVFRVWPGIAAHNCLRALTSLHVLVNLLALSACLGLSSAAQRFVVVVVGGGACGGV